MLDLGKEFLTSLGYLHGEPTLKMPASDPELKNESAPSMPSLVTVKTADRASRFRDPKTKRRADEKP